LHDIKTFINFNEDKPKPKKNLSAKHEKITLAKNDLLNSHKLSSLKDLWIVTALGTWNIEENRNVANLRILK